MEIERYTVTSALLYANGPIHIGHIAGAYLPADIFVRYHRLKGNDVVHICGSDEHGAAITLQAKKEGIDPKEIVDKYHNINKKTFKEFGIDFDIYHRTSSPLHHETSQDFFIKLHEQGTLNKQKSEQFFDERHSQFLADRYITGKCPKCEFEEAYGDQCEKCGSSLDPKELINPVSKLSGETPILKETSHWYLKMQDHEKWITQWINSGVLNKTKHHNPKNWRKQVLGQCKSWIKAGLKERAMTRDLEWGVKVPIDGGKGKVLYVWLDAPIGYISATKYWAEKYNKKWEDYWLNNNSKLVHFIGKDNIVFHCIIFPIILKSMKSFNLPINVPANEFLNLEGQKLSTSKNWAIWVNEYLKDFKGQQDSLRYTLCSTAPETKDTDFRWSDFQSRNNNELVAIFGNFFNRVVVLINKYWDGTVPKLYKTSIKDEKVLKSLKEAPAKIGKSIESYKFKEALQEVLNLCREGNKYLADNEPWKLKNIDEERTSSILYISIQICASLSILCEPFLPFTAIKMKKVLNLKDLHWDQAIEHNIKEGSKINKPELLFVKIEDDQILDQIQKLKKN